MAAALVYTLHNRVAGMKKPRATSHKKEFRRSPVHIIDKHVKNNNSRPLFEAHLRPNNVWVATLNTYPIVSSAMHALGNGRTTAQRRRNCYILISISAEMLRPS